MEVDNPYLQDKRKLVIELDKAISKDDKELIAKLKTEFDDVEYKCREFTQSIINEYESKIEHIPAVAKQIKKDYPSVGKQIEAVISLHRDAKKVCDEVKDFKMKLYAEQRLNRLQKKMSS